MKTLHSLSELKKLKIAPAPGGTSTPAKQPAPTEDPPVAPKRTPREEFAALLGDSAPPPAKRGIGQKAPPAQKAPERPQEAPAPRRAPTVRIVGPAGEQALSAGSLAVLQPGETKLVVEAEGAAPITAKLVVEAPEPKVVVREDAARDDALATAEAENARLQGELAAARAEIGKLRTKARASIRIDVDELFPGEGYEHVIEALAREAEAAKAVDGRRAEILDAVVKSNPPATELPRRRRIVDEVIVSARRPGPRELASLAEIGIREVSKNKHYKLGYGKHTQTLALTPSDHRGGQNAAAEMKKKFF